MLLLPFKYREKIQAPFSLTPFEMLEVKPLLQVHEAAYCLNVSERRIYAYMDEGKVRRTNEKPYRIPSEDIKRMMNDLDE